MFQSDSPSVGRKDLDKTKKGAGSKPPRGPRLQAIKLDPELQPLLPRDAPIQEYPSALARSPQIGTVRPLCVAMYALTFLFAVTLCYGIVAFSQSISCLGPPYIYVTHRDSRNIVKFSRDGCLLHEKVLWGVSNAHSRLRSMVLGTYKGHDALFVADAEDPMSGLLVFGACYQSTSLRTYVTRAGAAASTGKSPAATGPGTSGSAGTTALGVGGEHAYGLSVDAASGHVFVSYQDTENVFGFDKATLLPLPPSSALIRPIHIDKYSEDAGNATKSGDISQGEPKKDKKKDKKTKKHDDEESEELEAAQRHNATTTTTSTNTNVNSSALRASPSPPGLWLQFSKHSGVRALEFVRNTRSNRTELWVALEQKDFVAVVDAQGSLLEQLHVVNPISVHYPPAHQLPAAAAAAASKSSNLTGLRGGAEDADFPAPSADIVYVSSKAPHHSKGGAVFAIHIPSRQVVRTFQSLGMKHPAGLALHRDVLFVADQTRNAIILFNATNARVLRLLPLEKLGGTVEQILLSPC